MRKAVFLDRDGVINRAIVRDGLPFSPRDMSEFVFIEGIGATLERLKSAGFLLFVVTNQPDVGRGVMEEKVVHDMHALILGSLPIEAVEACFDCGRQVNTARRKPNPGMILDLAEKYGVDRGESYVVGDRWKDIEAGKRSGCKTIFIDYGYKESLESQPDFVVRHVNEIGNLIVHTGDRDAEPT